MESWKFFSDFATEKIDADVRVTCLFWSYNELGLTNGQSRCVFKRGYLLMTRETVREMKRVTGHSIKWKCDLAWTLSAACMQIKVSLTMDFPSCKVVHWNLSTPFDGRNIFMWLNCNFLFRFSKTQLIWCTSVCWALDSYHQ